ncbi:MAG: hypothetical protein QOF61_2110 [Acidobacteriota bacterium]|nr:hypothetical protein [Acidobacteriota bacterium]
MPTRPYKTGKPPAGEQTAQSKRKKSTGSGGAPLDDSDPPIIIQGGGSVDMFVPGKFKEKTSGPKGKGFKNDLGNLASIEIDGSITIALKSTSKIVIYYS